MEQAFLWVQIWDAPLDMGSPLVAKEVGSRLGTVEEVEKKEKRTKMIKICLCESVWRYLCQSQFAGGIFWRVQKESHMVQI